MKKIILILILCFAVFLAAPMWAEPIDSYPVVAELGSVLAADGAVKEVAVYQPFSIESAVLFNINMIPADNGLELGILTYLIKPGGFKPESIAYIMNY